jgi:hypothetical protein
MRSLYVIFLLSLGREVEDGVLMDMGMTDAIHHSLWRLLLLFARAIESMCEGAAVRSVLTHSSIPPSLPLNQRPPQY